jgi:uncharacterized lipoprotein YmbA
VREALQQLTQTLQSLNALSDYLERHPESLIRGKQDKKRRTEMMGHRFFIDAAAVAVISALTLAGCTPVQPPEHFYSLSNGRHRHRHRHRHRRGSAGGGARRPTIIEVPAVSVPQQVSAQSAGGKHRRRPRIDLLEQERWAGAAGRRRSARPCRLAVTGELGTIDVFRTPYAGDGCRCTASAPTCSASNRRRGSMRWWMPYGACAWSAAPRCVTCRSVANEPVVGGYDALVAGHRRAVARVGADISKAIRTLAAGGGAGC